MTIDDTTAGTSASDSLFTRYTTTAALAEGDDADIIAWSIGYFNVNFARLLPKVSKDAAILEIACGYGRYLKALSLLGYSNCRGVDISEEQVAYARIRLDLSNVEKADALEWLKDKKEQFDCILAIDFFEHVPTADLFTIGQLINEALKPGGRLIIQVPNGMSPVNPMIYGDLTHVRAFTVQSLRQLLLHAGFRSFGFSEVFPYLYDWKSRVRYGVWRLFFRPAVHLFSLGAHGKMAGGIYTGNIVSYADKERIG